MGMDQCGFLALSVGPVSEERQAAGRVYMQQLREVFAHLRRLTTPADGVEADEPTDTEQEQLIGNACAGIGHDSERSRFVAKVQTALTEQQESGGDNGFHVAVNEIDEFLQSADGNELVDQVIGAHTGNYRDSATSWFRVGTEQIHVSFNGAMTWGDSPDGCGYQAMSWAYRLGLCDVLGIQ